MLTNTNSGTAARPTRIVIADDHPFFVDGFEFALKKYPQVQLAGRASNGRELLKLVEETQPDIVFTDVKMPVMDGISATRQIRQQFPYIPVIAYSGFAEDNYITDMVEAGVSGYLLKEEHISGVLKAIDKVRSGEVYYSFEVSNRLVALMQRTQYNPMKPFDKPRLTQLEINVLKETCTGLSSKEAALKLHLPVRTVESARERIIQKTGCRNSVGMVLYAIKNSIIKP